MLEMAQQGSAAQYDELESTLTSEQHAEILSQRLAAALPTVPPAPPLPPASALNRIILPTAIPALSQQSELATASRTLREGVGESLRGAELERLLAYVAAERRREVERTERDSFIETIDREAARAESVHAFDGEATMSMRPVEGPTVAQQLADASAVLASGGGGERRNIVEEY